MCAAMVLAAAIVSVLLGQLRFFQIVHLKAQDAHFVVRGTQPAPEVVLLLVDQKSLDTIPELQLFWHPYYAEAIRAAADNGAKVLGLDIAFGIPVARWEPNHDQVLAGAVAETAARMPVVCGYVPAAMEKQRDWPVPINMVAAALGLSAYANLTVDADDFVRRQELIEAGAAEPLARSLALRVAEKYLGADARLDSGRLTLAGRQIPARTILIDYVGPPGTVGRVSLSDFLAAARAGRSQQLRDWVAGKAVLLGPDNSIEDRHATPYYTAFTSAQWNTAGVEIHASTVQTLLRGTFLRPAPAALRGAALLVAAGLTVGTAAWLPAGAAAAWFGAIMAGILLATHLLFRTGVLLSTSELVLATVVALLFSLAFRFLTAERMGTLFQTAVSVFVGKRVARSLVENQSISLASTRQEVTILFSDIRGFTAFCESKDPTEVVNLLNEYFAAMVGIIMARQGHVNKFIGDGILAVFSDQDGAEPGDHAARAVRCGIAMTTAAQRFSTGVGIHTGVAVIGNVGSSEKLEYTVLGDTVNVASRLESLNKEQKTKLLLSEATCKRLPPELETIYLGAVPVRGQTQPVRLYTAALVHPERKGRERAPDEMAR